ncbi:hypothetical protein D3C71_1435200 [compost metagenome]
MDQSDKTLSSRHLRTQPLSERFRSVAADADRIVIINLQIAESIIPDEINNPLL